MSWLAWADWQASFARTAPGSDIRQRRMQPSPVIPKHPSNGRILGSTPSFESLPVQPLYLQRYKQRLATSVIPTIFPTHRTGDAVALKKVLTSLSSGNMKPLDLSDPIPNQLPADHRSRAGSRRYCDQLWPWFKCDPSISTSPQPANSTKKIIDSSARNPLIYRGVTGVPSGLRPALSGEGRREGTQTESKTCRLVAEMDLSAVHKNPQESAQTRGSRQKKANPEGLVFYGLVELGGFEPPSASLFRADLHV
jgi:hypothetical protein